MKNIKIVIEKTAALLMVVQVFSAALKIFGAIDFDWVWILAPSWLPLVSITTMYILMMSFYYTVALINKLRR